jgi:DNA-binding transcriptional ArsR family regulator
MTVDAGREMFRRTPKRSRATMGTMPRSSAHPPSLRGDADLAALGAVLAEPARARILLALADGRALPATTLAADAGIAASTASGHLSRLLDAGLLAVRQQGRYRYYELAGPQVGEMIETLARLAPAAPVRSLREGTRAHALRRARTCYDHVAGRLGVAVFSALIEQRLLIGGDGRHHPERAHRDRLSQRGRDVHYELTPAGGARLRELGVPLAPEGAGGIPVRYCVDWTEQAHHLSGAVGRSLTGWMLDQGWLERLPRSRALRITGVGARGLSRELGVDAGFAGAAPA